MPKSTMISNSMFVMMCRCGHERQINKPHAMDLRDFEKLSLELKKNPPDCVMCRDRKLGIGYAKFRLIAIRDSERDAQRPKEIIDSTVGELLVRLRGKCC